MDPQTKYLLALGGFRRAVRALAEAGTGLQTAAHDLDPACALPIDPVAEEVSSECVKDLRGMADLMPGVRQLFAAAIGA